MVVNELLNLGLSQKEAEVYLAALQLGSASVQKISDKAELNRTSTYTYIKNLIARGLVSTLEKNGKQFFIAEKPEKLKYFCEQQEKEIVRRKETIEKIMPELESLYNLAVNRPAVRFFEHSEAQIAMIREEIVTRRYNNLYNIFNYEHFKTAINSSHIRNLLESTQSFQAIYISKNQILDRKIQPFIGHEKFAVKYLPFSKFDFLCEVLVADDTVYIARQKDSLVIKDGLFSQTLKLLFFALWNLAQEI